MSNNRYQLNINTQDYQYLQLENNIAVISDLKSVAYTSIFMRYLNLELFEYHQL